MKQYEEKTGKNEKTIRIRKIPKRDLEILYSIFKYRVLTTSQIMTLHEITKWYLYKKLIEMEKKGYIIHGNLHNLYQGKRQGNYYRLLEGGLKKLRDNNYDVGKFKAYDLKVSRDHLPHLVLFNDIQMVLSRYGWKYKDSRALKEEHFLNRNSIIHGMFISPNGTEYGVYITLKGASPTTISRINTEMMEQMHIQNYLIFTRDMTAFTSVIQQLHPEKVAIYAESCKVLSTEFGKYFITSYPTDEMLYAHLANTKRDLSFKTHFESLYIQEGLSTVVEHEGEEKYFVSLIDNDLVKINNIRNYNTDRYERDGRKVLIATVPQLKKHQQAMLKTIHHAEFYMLSNAELF